MWSPKTKEGPDNQPEVRSLAKRFATSLKRQRSSSQAPETRRDPGFAPPHELFPWEYAMKRKPPQTPGIALGCPRSCFRSVVRSHRAVMQWRQPCSIHLCDEHGCIQPVDAGGETTRRHEPRGVSGTLKVSPTGSIPHRENPAGKSPMTRSKPLGPSFASGSKHQREYGH